MSVGEETSSYHQAGQLRLEEDQPGLLLPELWWHEGWSRMIHQQAGAQDQSEVGIDFSGNTDFVFCSQFIIKLGFLIHTDPFGTDCADRYYSFQSH